MYKNEDEYEGHFLEDKPHGEGHMKYKESGHVFKGKFYGGTGVGRARITKKETCWGQEFEEDVEGTYVGDKLYGFVTKIQTTGQVITCDPQGGIIQVQYLDGPYFVGQHQNMNENGIGMFYNPRGNEVIYGEFKSSTETFYYEDLNKGSWKVVSPSDFFTEEDFLSTKLDSLTEIEKKQMRTALEQLEEIKQANMEDRVPTKEFKLEYSGNPKPDLGVMGYASDKAREIHSTLQPYMSSEWDVWM